MCRVVPPPDLISLSTLSGVPVGTWPLFLAALATFALGVEYTRRRSRRLGEGSAETILLGVSLACILAGIVAVVGLADPWDAALAVWFRDAQGTLLRNGCPQTDLTRTYAHLQATAGWLRGTGLVSGAVGIALLQVSGLARRWARSRS